MIVHDFQKSIIVGQQGESIIEKYFQNNPNVLSYINVSDREEYMVQDIDFIVKLKNNKKTTVELKTDTYNSGNIFFETVSNLEANTSGCMYVTKAKYLFYYFTKTNELYIIDMPKNQVFLINLLPFFIRCGTICL
jgi:hypothetical protein